MKKLKFLQYNEPFSDNAFDTASNYRVEHVAPNELGQVEFYRHETSWQNHKDNINGGNAVILRDEQNEVVGYSLLPYGK